MSILGNRVLRKEDPGILHGETKYVADIADPLLEGAVHATYVRSTMPHARIESIDVSAAAGAPGVLAVLTASDMGLTPQPSPFNPGFAQCPLALDVVRYVGEPLAVVITEEPWQGEDAAELVVVEYDPLPVVVAVDDALRDEVVLFPEAGTNTCMDSTMMGIPAATDDLFDGCEVVVSQRLVNQRLAACPIEVRSAAVAWTEDGRLVQWATSQIPHMLQGVLTQVYSPPGGVRVITPPMGGGFGPKSGMYPEEIVLGGISAALQRPVRWTESRTENMQQLGHGRAQVHDVTIGGTRDGTVTAYRLEIIQDVGAYVGFSAVIPTMLTRPMAPGVYDIERVECTTRSVVTNTTPTHSYRGSGRPEATAAIERAMDLFAAELGRDPVDVRRQNLLPAFDEPITTSMGSVYDVGNYEGALDLVLEHADYDALRAEQARRRADPNGALMGIGVSCYVEITGQALPGEPHKEIARVVVARGRIGDRVHGHLAARAGPRDVVGDDRLRRARHPDGADLRRLRRHRQGRRGWRHVRVAVAPAGRDGRQAGQR